MSKTNVQDQVSDPFLDATSEEAADTRERIAGYPVHPAASLFPLLAQDELQALADDIAEHGQLEPILLYQGAILDGRNRARACELAGVAPKVEQWRPSGTETPSMYVVSRNLRRRHMNASQRATVAVELSAQISQERAAQQAAAEARKVEFTSKGQDKDEARKEPSQVAPGSPFMVLQPQIDMTEQRPRGRARDQAAAALNVSAGYVTDAKNLATADPERFAQVRAGTISLPEANRQLVAEAKEKGTLDDLPIRPGAKRDALSFLEQVERDAAFEARPRTPARTPAERKAMSRPDIKIPKFGKLDSTRVEVTITLTMGHPSKAEEVLSELNRDERVIDIEYDVKPAAPSKKRKK